MIIIAMINMFQQNKGDNEILGSNTGLQELPSTIPFFLFLFFSIMMENKMLIMNVHTSFLSYNFLLLIIS